jgi:hypothetical protein
LFRLRLSGWPARRPAQVRYTEEDFSELRRAEATGRPLGAPEFVTGLEKLLGRKIARRAPGRKPTTENPAAEQLRLL